MRWSKISSQKKGKPKKKALQPRQNAKPAKLKAAARPARSRHPAKSPKPSRAAKPKKSPKPAKSAGPSKSPKPTKPQKPSEQRGIPSKEECFRLWDGYRMPDNIKRHTLQVTRIAVFIAKKLKESGIKVDITLTERGALLHDIDKILTVKNDLHGEVAEKILLRRGYPEIAKIASHHRFKYIRDPALTWEEKVVNYADKRVKHDQIVSLDERFTDLLIRYDVKVPDHEAIQMFFQLEKELFGIIHLDPMRLADYLSKERP